MNTKILNIGCKRWVSFWEKGHATQRKQKEMAHRSKTRYLFEQ